MKTQDTQRERISAEIPRMTSAALYKRLWAEHSSKQVHTCFLPRVDQVETVVALSLTMRVLNKNSGPTSTRGELSPNFSLRAFQELFKARRYFGIRHAYTKGFNAEFKNTKREVITSTL